jgi:hypothetical protein
MDVGGKEVEKVKGRERRNFIPFAEKRNCRKHFSGVRQNMHMETRRPGTSTMLLGKTERMWRIRSLLYLI